MSHLLFQFCSSRGARGLARPIALIPFTLLLVGASFALSGCGTGLRLDERRGDQAFVQDSQESLRSEVSPEIHSEKDLAERASARASERAELAEKAAANMESQAKKVSEEPRTAGVSAVTFGEEKILMSPGGEVSVQASSPTPSAELVNPAVAAPVASVSTSSAPAPRHAGKVMPETSLRWLKNGNTRFRKGFLRNDGQSRRDIRRMALGQSPHAIVVSCSDSRVPPELIFDQKLGEIFVVRAAGTVVDDVGIASIEYAVEHLGANLIVVLGHTSCGAVKASLGTLDGRDAGSPALNALVASMRPRLMKYQSQAPRKDLADAGWDQVEGVATELLLRSRIVRQAVREGSLQIQSALYHLDGGMVHWNRSDSMLSRAPAASGASAESKAVHSSASHGPAARSKVAAPGESAPPPPR